MSIWAIAALVCTMTTGITTDVGFLSYARTCVPNQWWGFYATKESCESAAKGLVNTPVPPEDLVPGVTGTIDAATCKLLPINR